MTGIANALIEHPTMLNSARCGANAFYTPGQPAMSMDVLPDGAHLLPAATS